MCVTICLLFTHQALLRFNIYFETGSAGEASGLIIAVCGCRYGMTSIFPQKVACLIWEERDTHVIRIQRQYRRWKGMYLDYDVLFLINIIDILTWCLMSCDVGSPGYKIFLRMHDARPYNGELADVFLDKPRYNVQFFIDHRVRSERRRVWQAAVMVQKEWRKRGHRM